MKTNVSGNLALIITIVAHSWADEIIYPPARGISTNVMVVRGVLISSKENNSFPLYRIMEVRGTTDAHEVVVFSSLEGYESALPTDAIMLLDASTTYIKPKDGRICFPLVSRDPHDALFPYTLELWTELCAKSDADLADSAPDKQMPMCDALITVYPIVREKRAGQELFFRPPRRRPYGWIITVFRVNAPYINDDYYTVMDSGKVYPPGMRCGLLVKPNADISTPDTLNAYLRDTYKDKPEEMPRRFEELCGE